MATASVYGVVVDEIFRPKPMRKAQYRIVRRAYAVAVLTYTDRSPKELGPRMGVSPDMCRQWFATGLKAGREAQKRFDEIGAKLRSMK